MILKDLDSLTRLPKYCDCGEPPVLTVESTNETRINLQDKAVTESNVAIANFTC